MEKYTVGMNGKDIKLVDNQDGSYSFSARPEYVPVTVKVPAEVDYWKSPNAGYPVYIDEDDNVYYRRNATLFVTKDGISEERVIGAIDFADTSEVDTIDWFYKTKKSGRYVISLYKSPSSNGQIWSADSLDGPWEKVLDVNEIEGLGKCHFRYNAFWPYFDGVQDIILSGTYAQRSDTNTEQCADVYMSTDEGETFQRIFRADTYREDANRHIHAVAYDPWDGWIWVTHGDGINRGISYSYDWGENWVAVSQGSRFNEGGWQPTGVVPLINTTAFGTDNSVSNGILTWYRPETTNEKDIKTLGYAWQKLHHDGEVYMGRRGAQISGTEAYIAIIEGKPSTTIIVTGDGGFSWHAAKTFSKGIQFEHGFTNPDSEGYVWGSPFAKFKVTKWEEVTKWVKNRHVDTPYQH